MPMNQCQTVRALDAASSPCVTCAKRESCPVQRLHRAVIMAQVGSPTNKRAIVSACSGYVPPGTNEPASLDIRPSMAAAGVADLCAGCTEPAELGCDEHGQLAGLKDMAKNAYGIDVVFATICCSVKRLPIFIGQIG
ncbi:MAG TPA: hypothetical protein VL500_00095 [Candidatus Eisenbacteria bacterium]|nr:hypothetical protein [Candidatus Eisenbacteria bacterium]